MKAGLKIKVCGMRDAGNIRSVSKLRPDYLGFIFFSGSQRFIGENPEALFREVRKQTFGSKLTGVFVNESAERIIQTMKRYGLHTVQLHGQETPDTCARIQASGAEVIKAFGMDSAFDFSSLTHYEEVCDFFLFDTKTSGHGGSGKTFDWTVLNKYKSDKPYFVSGGLSLENIGEINKLTDHRLFGADLNSRFEVEPGIKDMDLLAQAFNLLKTSERI